MTATDPTPAQHAAAIDTAWRIHQQVADWTGKTDAKASFFLGFQTALFGALIYLRTEDRVLSDLESIGPPRVSSSRSFYLDSV